MARTLTGRLLTGGLVILIGILLLLETTGLAETGTLWDLVPALFVLLGVWALLRSDFRNLTGPVLVIAVAGTFLLRNLGIVTDELIGTWWPLLLVLFGTLLVVSRSRRRGRLRNAADSDGEITAVGVFGGGDRRLSTDAFTGAEIVAVFGGVDLDLRDVSVPTPPAVVETVCLFGGSDIRVPESWDVRLDVLALFGGASDSRPRRATSPDDAGDRGEPDLVVTGLVLFGGVEIVD
ncbi:hypothetical protein DVK02_10805 [Halobellus sp. Atlit-31R]|nr:hypothetical protein DVK02_10805 [Halobellus sp. Atlit-31R]